MKTKLCLILIVLFLFLGAGCYVMGTDKKYQPFDADALQQVKVGSTKAEEVCDIFGAPTNVVRMSNGNAYVYNRTVSKGTAIWLLIITVANYEKQQDQIVFFFDNDDILTHYGVSLDAAKASHGF